MQLMQRSDFGVPIMN